MLRLRVAFKLPARDTPPGVEEGVRLSVTIPEGTFNFDEPLFGTTLFGAKGEDLAAPSGTAISRVAQP